MCLEVREAQAIPLLTVFRGVYVSLCSQGGKAAHAQQTQLLENGSERVDAYFVEKSSGRLEPTTLNGKATNLVIIWCLYPALLFIFSAS